MERSSFHYPKEKRSGGIDPGSGFGSSKRVKTHHAHLLAPLVVPVGHASFRFLCPVSQVGAVIGKSGSVIKQLQQSTGAKIRVEEPPSGSPDRVITIIAQVDSKSKVKLGGNNNGKAESDKVKEEEVEVSKAQGALIRVFEVLAAEADSATIVCRLLTESTHAGAVIGKGGQIVGNIRKETGCKIAIRTENLPVCADSGDEMVEIEGSVLAVKKALLSVSRCLQDCQSVNKIRLVGNRSLEKESQQASSHRPIETIIQESLPRPVEVNTYNYRPRIVETFPSGALARHNEVVIPHDGLHQRHIEADRQDALRRQIEAEQQDTFRRHIEADRQDALRRHIEAEQQDALRRHTDLVPRETLYRHSDVGRRDVFGQQREADDSNDFLRRPFEMVQRDAMGIPFESFSRDPFGRRIETIPQETLLRRPSAEFLACGHSSLDAHPSADFLARGNSILDTHPSADFLARGYSSLDTRPQSITSSASMPNAAIMKPPISEVEDGKQEVVFKILCSTENAGGVIGTGGKVIRTIHSETGAFINVGNAVADCEERLIAVTAPENPENESSPAQKAILLVFSRLFELSTKKIVDNNGPRTSVTARLVVPTSQIGCLLGKGGVIVSEMRKTTGTGIQILKVEQNPKCVSENDQVVQISGEFPNVREAVFHITSRLRNSLFVNSAKHSATKSNSTLTTERNYHGQSENPPSIGSNPSFSHPLSMSSSLQRRNDESFLSGPHSLVNYSRPLGTDSYIRPEDPFPERFNPSSADYSPHFSRHSTMDHSDISHHLTETNPSRLWASPPPSAPRGLSDASGGLSSARAGLVLSSGHKSAIVTNTTVEIRVPENAMSFVYGENGYNLEQLRQMSGARVIVHEPQLGTSDRIIVISGTPDQTQTAQNLLHAFIHTGETSLSKKYNLN